MSKRLVAYFSASGVTARVAENLADAIGADIFEIQPEVPYSKADLNWMDKKARSTIEMSNPTSRPAIAAKRDNMDEYGIIFVGFPIWWYVAPTIINTFLESYNLKGKTIIPFATSGGSGMGKTNEKLAPSCPGAKLLHGKVFNSYSSKADLSPPISLSVRLPILYVPYLPKHYCYQFQKHDHTADHLRYHKNRKSTDQHLKCFHPLRLLHKIRKNRRCQ